MALFPPADQRFAAALSRLIYCNPFLPERVELERTLLGKDFEPVAWVYHRIDELDHEHPNLTRLDERAEQLAARGRERLARGARPGDGELSLYADLVTYLLYRRFRGNLTDAVACGLERPAEPPRVPFWGRFLADFDHFLQLPGLPLPAPRGPAYLLACYFQVRRAFYQIYHHIAGASRPAARLRGAVWQSIFTHDQVRYFRLGLYDRMGRFPTLITGPSGSGKELAARAVGLSRFVPFDPESGRFVADVAGSFHALNVSALPPTLVESELFGHAKGSFTGAVRDATGWLEKCPDLGTVFLDEVGELDPVIQVKLLRVLQERTFYRLGDTRERHFRGKIIAATNRDLGHEMRAGRFREDFYYRLCGDVITTPSLASQLADHPDDLRDFLRLIVRRITDDVEGLASEVEGWIKSCPALGAGYAWPGNFRELEQCAWNVLIRKEYHPARGSGPATPPEQFLEALTAGTLTADELERHYYTWVFSLTGSNYQETSRRLRRDWRTVKGKIDPALLEQFGGKDRL